MGARAFSLSSRAPAIAAGALVVWAASIWWMVATLPGGQAADTSTLVEAVSVLHQRIEAVDAEIAALGSEAEMLREERDALSARLDGVEAAQRRAPAALALAGSEDGAGADGPDASHPLFTDGVDRFNCRDFVSLEEANEALRVNGPGDPNHIDMNGNGIACEDIVYRTASTEATAGSAAQSAATEE